MLPKPRVTASDGTEPPAFCGTESEDGEDAKDENGEKEEEDVPIVRSRP